MRFDLVLDSLYVLSSLSGALATSPVCSAGSSVATAVVRSPAAAEVTAFVGVAVIPMDSNRVLANQTVLVSGGRITALGPANQVPVPTGAIRIDGRGKYLIPGLTDMHAHFLHDNVKPEEAPLLFSFLASGVTAIRNTNPFSGEAMQAFRRSDAAALSPYIHIAGRVQEFVRPGVSPDSVASAYRTAGYNFLIDTGSDSIQAAALRLGLPRGIHIPHNSSLDDMLTYGRGTAVEHLYRFVTALGIADRSDPTNAGQRKFEDVPAAEIQKLAATVKRAGMWVTPTIFCMGGNRPADPRTAFLGRIVKTLQDEGVGLLLAGDDAGDVHDELAALVRAGLSPYQALLTGTRNTAQYLGILDSSGTVAVGKRADLVLLYGNPLADIRHTREAAGVMRNGRWFDRAELDRRLLASPKTWFTLHVSATPSRTGYGMGRPGLLASMTREQAVGVREPMNAFEKRADSLEAAKALGASEYERLTRSLTDELGKISALLTPEQHVIFDPIARVWLREHARQGRRQTIPGVAPVP